MPDLHLTESDQRALRSLLAAEPIAGSPLPSHEVLHTVHQLVPCDELAAVYSDLHGRVSQAVDVVPRSHRDSDGIVETKLPSQHRTEHDGPFRLGLMHWRHHPAEADHCGNDPRDGDGLSIGFRNGVDHVVQYAFLRESRLFTERDLAPLDMLNPVFQRLVRERPTPQLPPSLTLTERRVLSHVAAGRSNAETAESLCVSIGTVRKHLEHAYRKLGVTNRMAALARLQGRDGDALDLRERLDRYA